MHYATHYNVGNRKRNDGINEDSVAVTVFEQGHRSGLTGQFGTDDGDETFESVDGPVSERQSEDGENATNRSVAVFALADGAGGHDAGDVASYIATTVVCEQLAAVAVETGRRVSSSFDVSVSDAISDRADEPSATDFQTAVESAIVTAHREIIRYATESETQAYTTIVAGILVDGECHYGWVGDSRAYVVNAAHDSIELLTKDHGVVEQLRDLGEVNDVEAHVHPRGNEITRALGGAGDVDPEAASVPVDTNTVPMYAEDVLLVTSDGLIDAQTDAPALYDHYIEEGRSDEAAETVREESVTDDEIRDGILSADSLDDAARGLVELANDRGGKDNLSTILVNDTALPSTPDEIVPTRAVDPDDPIEERTTVLIPEQ